MSKLFQISMIVAIVLTLPVLVGSLVQLLMISPAAAWANIGIAIFYIGVVVTLLRFTPLWPRWQGARGHTGVWWVLCALLWGGSVAPALVFAGGLSNTDLALTLNWEDSIMSFGGAWPEEPTKAIGVLFVLLAFRRLHRPWHGFVVGMIVGLGFETVENVLYGSMGAMYHAESDLYGMLEMWGLRMVYGPFLHIAMTGIAGWGIGLALFVAVRSLWWRLRVFALYFGVAFLAHFIWNYLPESSMVHNFTLGTAAVLLYGTWLFVWVRAWQMMRADHGYVFTQGALTSLAELPALPAPKLEPELQMPNALEAATGSSTSV
ncbi:PrsW family glutamic-type intramembrane protease [Corynebacterium breve]|uniref:PrsW family glutamic-type intramembrane protease n=1 Tax=Corynebacterium breve TaxID=3049799 RepID=A0ABY8VHZ3_9CORY|nr:PrsW family glutamic-type intramembrane protease [Corynebacterium breve]WIM67863.1 PrsW family glutamic-type intramembrane protease [Corynebacterium breve]